ncbi:MAG: hypothetical protein A2268_03860 [Candidatus Raymondbacteria bacterium RifOxyA12_full_50_37]|uniref:FAD-dependent oxidoreductase n=1 Tax=Candidatus Raymondbacteria bacterium RIFOXYD12_FULL_49_13 TaxID=1817890 RepID=A0A1F7FB65_UNCRA|nr:MAG: hypothetical protein A2268_03860 [Candidatus Raymondbacteria bacterium RifOxyA12_full_50_37]OGJ92640.1 MAG: hypothetical protein A2248_06090 [Candidatus Raymondbacteria bacterium RIFOXYA2_FULL_49_16]OGJ97994.1 MAG: hypothetical protein A2453_03115 [Candidatus Raymondbacteria bacterium RIFOXYC2_FULL_50_21]OGJ99858.1 MAG: hypothetical protein A2487_10915 [Candidatus Raymondbacteria bacterium RifOxyC12_full_50_8]OGK03772.1 MAG: hypothetical protein A2519_02155 [Candidatus Raymondbacteria b
MKSCSRMYDVIVCGGGTGGVPAAVAAARNGARTLLIERLGMLGGTATAALVAPYMSHLAGKKPVNRGLFEEFCGCMKKEGLTSLFRGRLIGFDAEIMKLLLDKFTLTAGVELLFHATITNVIKKGGRIQAVRVFHRGGFETISGKVFIDATGDGDVAAMAGAPFQIGRDKDHACQPMTTAFRMGDINIKRMPSQKKINALYDAARKRREIKNPRENVLWFPTVTPNEIHFNTTRVVGESSVDGWSLTSAEVEGRRQALEMYKFLKRRVPGFEKATLRKIAPQIGVRESRRILGRYILTADDVLSARHCSDSIASGSYCIDIHNPSGSGTDIRRLEIGTWYQIPYRCITPLNVENLLMACRAISSTHEAHSSLRIMPIVWNIGEAAGTAAAMCAKQGKKASAINPALLRKKLKRQGAFI